MSHSHYLPAFMFAIVVLYCQSSIAQFGESAEVQTPDGVWASDEPITVHAEGHKGQTYPYHFRSVSFSPSINSQVDFANFVAGRDNLEIAGLSGSNIYEKTREMLSIQQVVPGISDDLFPEDQYDDLRDAFSSQCIDAAKKLNELIYGNLLAEHFSSSTSENTGVAEAPGQETINDTILRMRENNGVITPEVIDLVETYDNQCLSNAYGTLPSAIKRAVGVLTISNAPFCSATLIGEKKVVTARHCFIASTTGKPRDSFKALKDTRVAFYPLTPYDRGRLYYKLKGNPLVPPADPEKAFGVNEDVVTLDLMYAMPDRALAVDRLLRTVEATDPIWVVGYNSYISLKEPITQGTRGAMEVTRHIRFAPPKTCAVLRKTNVGCLFHSCQSAAGTSGASLIKMENGKASIIGIHKGAALVGVGCGADDLLTENINVAASASSIPP